MNTINVIMQAVSLIALFHIIYERSCRALFFRQAGYKTWGFNKVNASYNNTKEFVMPKTSWMCKSIYIGLRREFWWSPGGGFSVFPYVINTIIIILLIGLCLACWPIAIICFSIYWMLSVMLS